MLIQNGNVIVKGADSMSVTSITMRIDEDLKSQLQGLVSNLGMDMTTFLLFLQNKL